ncbi:hypothetical protein [Marispirochaeta aestuarii]|uniref:hypothetical protein n=1 Tax=Marispirochaeta aestuarii TaxID=1963862 RepID=UPI002ABE9315|nr:hypothetical protein [Marispirochaeta aestuarii]
MKKLALLLLALAIVIPAFADDAKVLPAGVLRTTIAAVYNTFDEEYDEDGDKVDATNGKVAVFNLGAALEYGITDQITLALQWTPGYNFYSDIEDLDDADVNGAQDLFIGAKAQFLGPNGFVPNDQMRFAAAAGVLVPLKSTDWKEEFENRLAGDEYNTGSGSREVIGLGFRLYYDYLVNKNFFVNLYNETIFFPEQETNTFEYAAVQWLAGGMNTDAIEDVKYAYGYKTTFEIEPVYTHPVNEKLDITGSLPFNYVMTPDIEIDGTEQDDSATSFLKMTPYVAAFFKTTMPFELKAGYSIPLMGKNNSVASTVVFQFKSYLKF